MTSTNIEMKVKELKELQRMSEEIIAEMESIKDELKKELEARNTEELTTNIYKARYSTVKTNRFDSAAFKKIYDDLYHQFTKETITKRFSIA